MRKLLLLLCVGLVSNGLMAQGFELFNFNTLYYPKQKVTDTDVDSEIGYKEYAFQFTIPQIFNDKKTVLVHSLEYGHLTVDTEVDLGNDQIVENTSDYHVIRYKFKMNQELNEKWRLMAGLTPTLASDLRDGFGGKDMFLLANVLLTRMKRKGLSYGFGLTYSTRFGRELIVPIFMYDNRTLTRRIQLVLPSHVSLMYNKPDQNFYYGVKAALNGALFNINNGNEVVSDLIDQAGYSRLNIGPEIEVRLKGSLYLQASGGITVARKLEFIDSNDDKLDRTPDNGPFIQVGFAIIPQRNLKKETK